MANVVAYHRPDSVDAALDLLARVDVNSKVLAGGTQLIGRNIDHDPFEVVDLQNAGLARVDLGEARAVIGATVTLAEMSAAAGLPDVLRDAARRELPSTLRTLATLGGVLVGGEAESEFLATLLAHDPIVEIHGPEGRRELPLPQLWIEPFHLDGRLITGVSIATDGTSRADRTARTPADRPIVAVVGRRGVDGRLRLACSGVAAHPVLVDDPMTLRPPADFRGSSEYRRQLAITLSRRVAEALS